MITLFIPTNIVRYFRVLSTLCTSLSATYTVYILLSDVYTVYIIVKRLHCLYVIARCSKSSSTLTSKVACRTKCCLHSPVFVDKLTLACDFVSRLLALSVFSSIYSRSPSPPQPHIHTRDDANGNTPLTACRVHPMALMTIKF